MIRGQCQDLYNAMLHMIVRNRSVYGCDTHHMRVVRYRMDQAYHIVSAVIAWASVRRCTIDRQLFGL